MRTRFWTILALGTALAACTGGGPPGAPAEPVDGGKAVVVNSPPAAESAPPPGSAQPTAAAAVSGAPTLAAANAAAPATVSSTSASPSSDASAARELPAGADPAMASDDPLARIAALRAIAGSNPLQGGDRAVATIVAGLRDENGEVRQAASSAAVQGANYRQRALANGQPLAADWAAEEALIAALRDAMADADPLVAAPCVAAYGRIVAPSPAVEAELLALVDPARPQVYQAVLVALEEHAAASPAYALALAAARADADPAVRAQAALSTARVLGGEAVAPLEAMRAAERDPLVTGTIDAALATARGGE